MKLRSNVFIANDKLPQKALTIYTIYHQSCWKDNLKSKWETYILLQNEAVLSYVELSGTILKRQIIKYS